MNSKGIPRRQYEREELELADRLLGENVSFQDVCLRVGRSPGSLATTLCRFRQGRWQTKGRAQRSAEIRTKLESLVIEEGIVNAARIAERMGMKYDTTHNWLRKIGLDREMREEIARDLQNEPLAA